ncbi:class I SAM-dependent methyltransferase [Halolamina sp. CBA1230]|uniref:class I SAM-dependent methyltransferase n=1 Tax=Halolamina sp. CBA1230 TaxID=1853690 RepID=UPI0009A1414E|nr:class I SAM-dependent methyltransferase [Halolamina sp. CBA1230]QKY20590.1 class I SAM-dependent methyltransferase [Halolamina sp. CBA1230]
MEVPDSVAAALSDRDVAGTTCLEAGAGVGNATAGLLDAGAEQVYAVTDRADHAEGVRERFAGDDRVELIEADLREIPLPDDSVEVVTAHALFNVLPADATAPIAAELTRVAAPGATLVVDDYDPMPPNSAVRQLFGVENAAAELANARPALAFYPADALRRLFGGHGWAHDRTQSILEPVPWTESHLTAHVAEVRGHAGSLPDALGKPLVTEAERLAKTTGSSDEGRMYSVAMELAV